MVWTRSIRNGKIGGTAANMTLISNHLVGADDQAPG
jgi:hypothetical protein